MSVLFSFCDSQSFFYFTYIGKTNHGQTLYGRATRHKDVKLCCLGALAFYLSYRFAITHKFASFLHADWCNNAKWFDVKLLVDVCGQDYTKPMNGDSYAKAIGIVLKILMIFINIFKHLGRKLGPKILEMLEEEESEIKTMGNWDPSIQKQSYSTKLPMRPIRKLAGYTNTNGMYYNL